MIYIEKKDREEATRLLKGFSSSDSRKRIYINALGAELVMKYLANENIGVANIYNMHNIFKIREEFDIADIMLPNIHIDVRMVYDENLIFIPKSHFEYDLIPDVYAVCCLSKDGSYVSFLGFFKPENINKSLCNDEYYFIKPDKLEKPSEFNKFVKSFKGNTTEAFSEDLYSSVLALADNDLNAWDKKLLIKVLKKSSALREEMIEFDNFEWLSYNASRKDIIDETIPEVPVKDEFDFFEEQDDFGDYSNEEALLKENISELTLPEESLSEDLTLEPEISVENELQENQEIEEASESIVDFETESENEDDNQQFETVETEEINDVEQDNVITEEIPDLSNTDELSDTELEPLDLEMLSNVSEITSEPESLSEVEESENLVIEDTPEMIQEESLVDSAQDDLAQDAPEMIQEESPVDSVQEDLVQDVEEMPVGEDEMSSLDVDVINLEGDSSLGFEEQPFDDMNSEANNENIVFVEDSENDNDVNETGNYSTEQSELADIQEYSVAEQPETINIEDSENLSSSGEVASSEDLKTLFGNSKIPDMNNSEQGNIEEFLSINENNDNVVYNYDEDYENQVNNMQNYENSPVISSENAILGEINLDINNDEPENQSEKFANDTLFTNEIQSDKSKKGNKTIMAVAAATAAVIMAAAGTYILMNGHGNQKPDVEAQTPTIPEALPPLDEQPIPSEDTEVIAQETLPQVPAVDKSSAQLKPIGESDYLSVSKIGWSIPDYVSYNNDFKSYLQTLGRSIKLSLNSDLLLATEYPYSTQIFVDINFSSGNNTPDVKISKSSGSNQIDKIVLQTVKETANVVKPPSGVIIGEHFKMTLKIYL